MHIRKMLVLICMGLATAAVVPPTAAQATQTHGLTENGVFIGAGAGVTITSTNIVIPTPLGTETCEKVTFHYAVETNTDEHVSLEPVNVGMVATNNETVEKCHLRTSNGTLHTIDVSVAGTDTATINTWGAAEVAMSSTTKITFSSPVTCTFNGNVRLQAKNGTSEITIGKSTLNGGLCGNGEISGTGTLETSNGTALTADIKAT